MPVKPVMSLWTKPLRHKRGSLLFGDLKEDWTCWILSQYLLEKHYGHVSLVTDRLGKYLLCDILRIPFDDIDVCMDDYIGHFPTAAWVSGKILACKRQHEPFMLVDHDVFMWKKLSGEIENAPLFAQSIELFDNNESERVHSHYNMDDLDSICSGVDCWEVYKAAHPMGHYAYSLGVYGGTDIGSLSFYSDTCMDVIIKSMDKAFEEKRALILDQMMFAVCSFFRNVSVACILKDYHGWGEVSVDNEFTHLWGNQNMIQRIMPGIASSRSRFVMVA